MATRGRKSAASLAIVTNIPGQRPEPPSELTENEADVWRSVVATKTADWFQEDSQPLLINYCRHKVRQKFLSDQINEYTSEWLQDEEGLRRYERLMSMSIKESGMISAIATKLRLTPQSRWQPSSASVKNNQAAIKRPWDK